MESIVLIFTNFIALAFIVISKKAYRTFINPIGVFNLSWTIIMDISFLGPYGLFRPPLEVFFMILILIVSFDIGFLLYGRIRINKALDVQSYITKKGRRLVCFLNILGLIYLIPYTTKALLLVRTYGWAMLRGSLSTDTGLGLTELYQWIIVSWLIAPMFQATIIITILLYLSNQKSRTLIIFSAIDMIAYTLTFGGRWIIFRFVLTVLIALILYKNKINFSKKLSKKRKYVIGGIIISIIGLIYLTSQRGYSNNVVRSTIIYFTGSLSYFSHYFNNASNYNLFSSHLLGSGFFSGILDFPLMIFQWISGLDFIRPAEYIGMYTSPTILIGDGIYFNGFASALLDFTLDFGRLGCLIDGFLLGIIMKILYSKAYSNNSIRWHSVYIFALILIAISPIKWELNLQWSWMTFIFLIILTHKKETKINTYTIE